MHDRFLSFGEPPIKMIREEMLGNERVVRLELIPKSDRLRNNFIARILLWIDPARGVSVQQQFFQPDSKGGWNGDYRLAKYSDIKINQKLPEDVFKLKTTKKTKFVSQQGQG